VHNIERKDLMNQEPPIIADDIYSKVSPKMVYRRVSDTIHTLDIEEFHLIFGGQCDYCEDWPLNAYTITTEHLGSLEGQQDILGQSDIALCVRCIARIIRDQIG